MGPQAFRVATVAVLSPIPRLFLQDGQPKQYVQDLVFGHGSLLYRLWGQEEGSLYVCGKVAMASGVQDALLTVLKHGGGMTKEEAAVRMTEFRKEGTYQEDIFTS